MSNIRLANQRDLPRCNDFLNQFGDTLKSRFEVEDPDSVSRVREFLLSATMNRNMCILIDEEQTGVLVGSISTHPLWNLKTAIELAWWIEPESRGLKKAICFIDAFEAWAQARKASYILLGSAPMLRSPEKLYHRRGYTNFESTFIKGLK
jgi:hypothetical protein